MTKIYSDDVDYAIKNLPLVSTLNYLAETNRDFIIISNNIKRTDDDMFYHAALLLRAAAEDVLACLAVAQEDRIIDLATQHDWLERVLQ